MIQEKWNIAQWVKSLEIRDSKYKYPNQYEIYLKTLVIISIMRNKASWIEHIFGRF